MASDTFYILTPPSRLPELQDFSCLPAHLAYRIAPNLRLLRLQGTRHLRGGVMTVVDCPHFPRGDPGLFAAELLRECSFRGFRGVILDLEHSDHPLVSILPRLETLLSRQGVTLFLPENYAAPLSLSRALISSAISGGSLSQRLTESVNRFGPDRTVLAVEKIAEDFPLPSPTGCGSPLSPEQLAAHRTRCHFFSPALCAQYSTYRAPDGSIHLVLFDDTHSLTQKLHRARCAGITRFLLPWAEIFSCPEQYGLPRFTQKKS